MYLVRLCREGRKARRPTEIRAERGRNRGPGNGRKEEAWIHQY